ncbi:MAG: hypothetical protein OEV78_12620 [Spirochaetia bacterium]|nr:hypothetical protein [Spirochaetia bacterium]
MQIDDFEFLLILIATLFFIVFLSWLIIKTRAKLKNISSKTTSTKKEKIINFKKEPAISVFEKFDYLGTKIYNNDGKYTVVEDDVYRNFNSINELPSRYQKMVLEMQTQKFDGRKDSYYMENKNGTYYIVFPDGSKKNYKNYNDIPEKIKKIMSSK